MTDDAPANPAPTCTDGYKSLEPWWIVKGPGPLAGFELRLDRTSYIEGEELTAKLHNVSTGRRGTGSRYKYDIQYRGTDGWHTIFGAPEGEDFGWDDIGILHPPGNGFTWSFTLTQDGLSNGGDTESYYHACQPVEPGTYRFVYWGVIIDREVEEGVETDSALGVTFGVESAR